LKYKFVHNGTPKQALLEAVAAVLQHPNDWQSSQPLCKYHHHANNAQAQTPEQRRRNAKFAKEQEARMGKSGDDIKKRTKPTPKSPISPVWISTYFILYTESTMRRPIPTHSKWIIHDHLQKIIWILH
jgi:hypothetical protein